MKLRLALFLLAMGAPTRALACEFDPFLFQLPGETVRAAQMRSNRIMSDMSIIRHFDRESYAFEKARRIYLARKVATAEDPKTRDRLTTVHPVQAIRGSAPTSDQRLKLDGMMGGMCESVGDGDIAHLPVGAYIVVFDGLPHDTYRPRGIDSFDVNEIRNSKLLDALRAFGKDLED